MIKLKIIDDIFPRKVQLNIPFPQANDLDRVFNILDLLNNNGLSKDDVADLFSINSRQGDYYLNALLYLGLVNKYNVKFFLSEKGIELKKMGSNLRKFEFCMHILSYELFHSAYKLLKIERSLTSKEKIRELIMEMYQEKMSDATLDRRTGTVIRWINWVDKSITESINNFI